MHSNDKKVGDFEGTRDDAEQTNPLPEEALRDDFISFSSRPDTHLEIAASEEFGVEAAKDTEDCPKRRRVVLIRGNWRESGEKQ